MSKEDVVAAKAAAAAAKKEAAAKKAAEKKAAAEKKIADALAKKREAEAIKAKAKEEARKAREKQKKLSEAEVKGKHQTALNTLAPIAKEINVRFAKAAKLESDADDHRLAAAIHLATARKTCEEVGLNFKGWAEKNVEQSYETIRKLVAVGSSDDPKAALEDLRGKNREANKAHRAKEREKRAALAAPAGGKRAEAPKQPYIVAEEALTRMDDKHVVDFLASKAKGLGMRVVSETEASKIADAKKVEAALGDTASLAAVKKAFLALKATEKMTFMSWAANETGMTLKNPLGDLPADEDFPVIGKDGKIKSTKAAEKKAA